jgi:hypothetical protein
VPASDDVASPRTFGRGVEAATVVDPPARTGNSDVPYNGFFCSSRPATLVSGLHAGCGSVSQASEVTVPAFRMCTAPLRIPPPQRKSGPDVLLW